jgi:lipopolysaccharide export LptBFGC system permease protein LptF
MHHALRFSGSILSVTRRTFDGDPRRYGDMIPSHQLRRMFDTLSRYVLSRTTARFVLLFIVFMGVLVGGQLAIMLGRGVPPEACLPMIQALSLLSLPIALPLALATAILVIIGGMNQDGEFRALAASGVGHRKVIWRIFPLIILVVIGCGVMTHVIMPLGIADIRANKGRLLQTAVASRVAEGEPIIERKGLSVWVGSNDGSKLVDVRALMTHNKEFIAVYSPQAQWVLAEQGIHLECNDVQMLVRQPGKHVMVLDTERYAYLFDDDLTRGDKIDPDALSTANVLALAAKIPEGNASHSVYNNARLTLQFRFFLPISLIAFSLLAMGLGLVYGTDQNLLGIVIIVVVVTAVGYPAFGYVKTNSAQPQINPGWIMWPPAALVSLIGLWMSWRPERAREIIAIPWTWYQDRRRA